jgi:hypothetical protein
MASLIIFGDLRHEVEYLVACLKTRNNDDLEYKDPTRIPREEGSSPGKNSYPDIGSADHSRHTFTPGCIISFPNQFVKSKEYATETTNRPRPMFGKFD